MRRLDTPWIRFFVDNLGWILISAVLAGLIWIVATLEENPVVEEQYRSPITIEFIQPEDANVSLFRSPTLRTTALVTVRGPQRSIDELERDDIRVFADLSELSAGTQRVELIGEIVDSGPTGRVIDVSPPDVTVEIVPVITDDTVPVRVDTPGELAPGFRVEEIACSPQTVSISGPSSIVTEIARGVVRIDLQNSDASFERSYAVEPRYSGEGTLSTNDRSNIEIQPPTVSCRVEVNKIEGGTQLLVGEPNFIGSLPDGYVQQDFTIEPPSVFVSGDPNLIATLADTVQTEPIDLNGQVGDFSREVAVILPEGLEAQPSTVTVQISVDARTITRQFTSVPIRTINVAASLSVTSLVPQSVDITISGPEPIVNELTLEDFRVTIDLQGRGAGTYTELPLTNEVLRSVNREELTITTQPQSVNVVIAVPPTATPVPTPTSIQRWGG